MKRPDAARKHGIILICEDSGWSSPRRSHWRVVALERRAGVTQRLPPVTLRVIGTNYISFRAPGEGEAAKALTAWINAEPL